MKIIGTWRLLALLAVCGTAWAQAKPPSDSTEKAIAALENQWLQSQKTNNPDLVAPLLADKFVTTGLDGKMRNKDQMIASEKQRKYASCRIRRRPSYRIRRYGHSDGRVQRYGH